ncbi:hypothetical protein ACEPAH_6465 [Sanghuangporus vaninii]
MNLIFRLYLTGTTCGYNMVLANRLGIKKLYCVTGFSMGGQQAYHWAIMILSSV